MRRFVFMAVAAAISLLAAGPPPAAASLEDTDEFNTIDARVEAPSEIPEASQGDAEYNIGVKYYNAGKIAAAAGWFRKAVDHGDVQGQSYLGYAYETGRGVRKNYGEALKWYELAAARNDKDAYISLGRLYAHGRGVRRDDVVAAKWFRLAAEQDVINAQYALGLFYHAGRGVKRDDGEAYFWLALASRKLDAAMKTRDEVAKHLSDEKLGPIRLRLMQWKPAD